MTREQMDKLENFSAKFEQLRNFIDFINHFVWQEIDEKYAGKAIERLCCLTEMLSDVAHIRDNDLEELIKEITLLHNPIEE